MRAPTIVVIGAIALTIRTVGTWILPMDSGMTPNSFFSDNSNFILSRNENRLDVGVSTSLESLLDDPAIAYDSEPAVLDIRTSKILVPDATCCDSPAPRLT